MLAKPRGPWALMEAVSGLEGSGVELPGARAEPYAGLPDRHDFISSVNSIFFSEEKDMGEKKRLGASKMPFRRLTMFI